MATYFMEIFFEKIIEVMKRIFVKKFLIINDFS